MVLLSIVDELLTHNFTRKKDGKSVSSLSRKKVGTFLSQYNDRKIVTELLTKRGVKAAIRKKSSLRGITNERAKSLYRIRREDFMENYYIVLSPRVGLSSAEFVAAWNREEDCRAIAIADLIQSSSQQYDLNLFADILLGLMTNIASGALYDLIRKALARRRAPGRSIHIEALQKPDGTRFLIIDIDEK